MNISSPYHVAYLCSKWWWGYLLVDFPDDRLEWVEVWSLHGFLRPALLDHVGQLVAAALCVIRVLLQRRPEVRALTILHFAVDVCGENMNHSITATCFLVSNTQITMWRVCMQEIEIEPFSFIWTIFVIAKYTYMQSIYCFLSIGTI